MDAATAVILSICFESTKLFISWLEMLKFSDALCHFTITFSACCSNCSNSSEQGNYCMLQWRLQLTAYQWEMPGSNSSKFILKVPAAIYSHGHGHWEHTLNAVPILTQSSTIHVMNITLKDE